MALEMQIPVNYSNIKSVKVNGNKVDWKIKPNSILQPFVQFETPKGKDFRIEINYSGDELKNEQTDYNNYISESLQLNFDSKKKIKNIYDPQGLIKNSPPLEGWIRPKGEDGVVNQRIELIKEERKGTFFVQVEQNGTTWWQPVNVDIQYPLETTWRMKSLQIQSSSRSINGKLNVNNYSDTFSVQKGEMKFIEIPLNHLSKGTNSIELEYNGIKQNIEITDWEMKIKVSSILFH